jgi:hypothetical protein
MEVADFLGNADKVGKVNESFLVSDELLLLPGSSVSIAPCNKVREVTRRRTVMFDDGGMNDQTSATI